MKHKLLILTILLAGFLPLSAHAEMSLQSADIKEDEMLSNEQVFNGFGCDGGNISPQLSWKDVPKGAKSLAITMYDPDAPTGSGWWHWVVFNIPVETKSIDSGAKMPEGAIQSRTDFGTTGFGGACPPEGNAPHRYIFTLYALDVEKLDLDENASGAMVGYFLNAHSIEKASITAKYGR